MVFRYALDDQQNSLGILRQICHHKHCLTSLCTLYKVYTGTSQSRQCQHQNWFVPQTQQ